MRSGGSGQPQVETDALPGVVAGVGPDALRAVRGRPATALDFPEKEDVPVPGTAGDWLLMTYGGISLGWCKNLGNRLNNYYPKEWRIRMQI